MTHNDSILERILPDLFYIKAHNVASSKESNGYCRKFPSTALP